MKYLKGFILLYIFSFSLGCTSSDEQTIETFNISDFPEGGDLSTSLKGITFPDGFLSNSQPSLDPTRIAGNNLIYPTKSIQTSFLLHFQDNYKAEFRGLGDENESGYIQKSPIGVNLWRGNINKKQTSLFRSYEIIVANDANDAVGSFLLTFIRPLGKLTFLANKNGKKANSDVFPSNFRVAYRIQSFDSLDSKEKVSQPSHAYGIPVGGPTPVGTSSSNGDNGAFSPNVAPASTASDSNVTKIIKTPKFDDSGVSSAYNVSGVSDIKNSQGDFLDINVSTIFRPLPIPDYQALTETNENYLHALPVSKESLETYEIIQQKTNPSQNSSQIECPIFTFIAPFGLEIDGYYTYSPLEPSFQSKASFDSILDAQDIWKIFPSEDLVSSYETPPGPEFKDENLFLRFEVYNELNTGNSPDLVLRYFIPKTEKVLKN